MKTSKKNDFSMENSLVSSLFDAIPEASFFVKERQSRFIWVNKCFLRIHGCSNESEMVGKSDYDFHPEPLAAQYDAEDKRVMETSQPVHNQAELVTHHSGMPRWYLCTKLPLSDNQNNVIGLAGVLTPIDQPGQAPHDYERLTPSLEYAVENCCKNVNIPKMAEQSGLSTSQLQRDFRKLFRMSPGEYILRLRLQLARRQLIESNEPVKLIASRCGFFDQSHFTRLFRKHTGLTPSRYRQNAWN